MEKLTLKKLYNTEFHILYEKLQKNEELSKLELEKVLSIGIFLTGLEDKNLQKLGYRLFLMYSKKTNDYKPLYELSLNKGLIPVSKFIENNLKYSEKYWNLYTEINSIVNNEYKWNNSYQTVGQSELFREAMRQKNKSHILVAPTSYGKTELILSFIDHTIFKKICIISPTKSLLAQTKKRIINKFGYMKIITFPDMYNDKDDEIVAVLTQERLLRLLQQNKNLKFDLLIIDEAHNLLEEFNDENVRSVILASVIIICKKRNNNTICKYLTPFLKFKESLMINNISNITQWYNVVEDVKSEVFYFYNLEKNKKVILDQYSTKKSKFIDIKVDKLGDDADVIIANCDNKNIIYLNTPRKLEDFAYKLFLKLPEKQVDRISKAANDLREFVHENYKLADYIRKGVIYHHGSIPEPIRYFIEDLYIELPELNMLIANSTLLEGVNIPATKMFILDPSKEHGYLSPSSFKNLIGRVCRFSEIFNNSTGDLKYLLPEIHIIKGEYCNKNFNANNFVKGRKILVEDHEKITDYVKNPLLTNSDCSDDKKKKAEQILENISHNDIITSNNFNKAKTKVGQLCFENNIQVFDILEKEIEIEKEIEFTNIAQNIDTVFTVINDLFFSKIMNSKEEYNNLRRLKEYEAQKFYKMLINWRIMGLNIRAMIKNMVGYWNSLVGEEAKTVYVGKWGDKSRHGFKTYWTDISSKSEYEKVNLAIVRLKEEYDFIDNEIIKYIEILNSLGLIEESLYLKIKYGTDNKSKITLLNCGISAALSKLLYEKYSNKYKVDLENSTVYFSKDLISEMLDNDENGVLISEVKMNSQD